MLVLPGSLFEAPLFQQDHCQPEAVTIVSGRGAGRLTNLKPKEVQLPLLPGGIKLLRNGGAVLQRQEMLIKSQ